MLIKLINQEYDLAAYAGQTTYRAWSMDNIAEISVQARIDVPAALVFASATDIDVTNDTFTDASPVMWTGVKGQFTTSSALPTGISAATDYWSIEVSTGVYKFATSLANALAGTAVNITTAGTGNQTFTPTTLSAGAIAFQKSNITVDHAASTTAAHWTDIETETAVTADATVWYEKVGPEWVWFRVRATTTDGSYLATLNVCGKGENKK